MPFYNLKLLRGWLRGSFRDGRVRLYGEFRDAANASPTYEWTPAWNDTARMLVEAVEVERLNEGGNDKSRHRFLEQFADVCREIIVKYANFSSAKMVNGSASVIERKDDPERLAVTIDVDGGSWVTHDLDVALTERQIMWLIKSERQLKFFLWNDRIVDVIGLLADDDIDERGFAKKKERLF